MSNANSERSKRKRKDADQAKDRTIIIPFPDTDDEEKANRILAKGVPGWEKLDRDEKSEIADLIRAYRKRGNPAKVTMTRKPEGGWSIEPAGKSETLGLLKLYETFSANSIDPVNARANELLNYLGSVAADNEGRYNAALSFIESMKPQDQAEALLLVQMYCTHDAAIRALSQLGSAEWVPTAQTFGNLATKLLRASQGQMETLSRLRRGGEQVVKHVHVDNRGGQAVIAESVNQGAVKSNNEDQCHTTGGSGGSTAMLGQDPQGEEVPISSREGTETVSDARRDQPGRAKGQSERQKARRLFD